MQTFYKTIIPVLFILLFTTSSQAQRSSCAASPYPITVDQPDGTSLTFRMIGNEMLNYRETMEGYTILPNAQGIYEYATLDAQGHLQSSGIKAYDQIARSGLAKQEPARHLRYSVSQKEAIQRDFIAMQGEIQKLQKTVEVSYPVNGSIRILAICMQFPDDKAIYPTSAIHDLMNQPNYDNTGSFRDYFLANSYGKLQTTVDVFGWYTTTMNRESYGKTLNNGSNNTSYNSNVQKLVAQAIDSADAIGGADFTKYDNDSNGAVDGIIIFQAGYGAEQGMNGYVWSHRSSLSGSNIRTKDGKTVRSYCINPLKRNWQGDIRMVGLGVLTHEFGHIMGLPDLYDTDQTSEGIGNFGLMGGCGWLNQERTPCQYESWSKDQFGWINPIVISNPGEYTLQHTLDTAKCYRINTPRANEYFLLENRQQKGWDRFMPSKGLAIWHINTQKTSLYPGSNTVNSDTAIYGVGLMQADGLRHLEKGTNRGDAGDLFPGSTNNRTFADNTNPSSLLHYKVSGIRQPSNVTISNITLNPDSTITFRIGLAAAAAFTPNTLTGCAPLRVTMANNSTSYASFKWYFPGNITETGITNPEVILQTAGTYTISLVIYDSTGAVADSTGQIFTVYPSPDAAYTATQVGDQLTLKNTSKGAAYHQWRFGTSSSSTLGEVTITIPQPGLAYYVVAFSDNGCTDTASGYSYPFPTGISEREQFRQFAVYPNPFQQELTMQFDLVQSSDVEIHMYSILGQEVYATSTKGKNGPNQFVIPVNTNWPAGVYLIRMTSAGQSQWLRVSKM